LLRQHAVLERTEEGGLGAHEKQHHQKKINAVQQKADPGKHHQRDLGELHPANEHRLVELVGDLACGGGKQKKRQDEQARGNGDHDLGIQTYLVRDNKGDENHQRVL
jgi:hypothetical protein